MPDYTFNYFSVPGADFTDPVGINADTITGYSTQGHSFIYSNGTFTMTNFVVPNTGDFQGAIGTQLTDINDRGDLTGTFKNAGSHIAAFVDIGGTFTRIYVTGSILTNGYGINNSDQVSGGYDDRFGHHHGYIYDATTQGFTLLDVSGATDTTAYGINNNGDVVGDYTDTNGKTHGFEYSNGVYTTIDVPGASFTVVMGINDHGDMVGNYMTAGREHGFVYSHGTFVTLVDPAGPSTTTLLPNNIDNAGDIVGTTISSVDNTLYGFEAVACYTRGTLIRTEQGDLPVESLAIWDAVVTASGVSRPIKWIGRRGYAGRFIMGNKEILPVCFKAGSLGDGLPQRDLWISPHHAMFLDGLLIEARDLINGTTIVQAESVDSVEYFHIELDSHDVIIAEGAWSETYVDDDSRSMFHNAHEYAALYPDEVRQPARYRAPRVDTGYALEAVRQRLARSAQAA